MATGERDDGSRRALPWTRVGALGIATFLFACVVLGVAEVLALDPTVAVAAGVVAVLAALVLLVSTWCEVRGSDAGLRAAVRAVLRDLKDMVLAVF